MWIYQLFIITLMISYVYILIFIVSHNEINVVYRKEWYQLAKYHLAAYDIFLFYFNPSNAELNNLNFNPPEVVSRWRDPQLQVGKNCS